MGGEGGRVSYKMLFKQSPAVLLCLDCHESKRNEGRIEVLG